MAAVEDGEILEVDNDDVVDLCSDAEPSPPPAPVEELISSKSRIRRNFAAFRANAYRGGDPFHPRTLQNDADNAPATDPYLARAPASFKQSNEMGSDLTKSRSRFHAIISKEEEVFNRNPYPTDNLPTPALHGVARQPPQKHGFDNDHMSPRGEMKASSLPTTANVGDPVMWPYNPSPNGPGIPLGVHPESRPVSQKPYDPERYSPIGDQSHFGDGLVYHAEPGPPPSAHYSMHHPSMTAGNPNFRQVPFVESRKAALHSMNHLQNAPPMMYDRRGYSGIVLNEQGIFIRDAPPSMQETPSHPQNEHNPKGASRGESEVVQSLHADMFLKRESSFHPSSYDRSYFFDAGRRAGSDMATEGTSNGLAGSEKRRKPSAPVMSSFSDDEGHQANSPESGDSPKNIDHTYGSIEDDHSNQGKSTPKEEQFPDCLPQDDASDGEISSPPVPSPVISLATAPDETPSPPSLAKKKSAGTDAKKRLSELRMKALMSVKKRPTPRNSNDCTQPVSPRNSPLPAISTGAETLENPKGRLYAPERRDNPSDLPASVPKMRTQPSHSSDELTDGLCAQADSVLHVVVGGIRRTMTQTQFTQWQEWPYQNPVLVDYSSDSSESTDTSDADDSYDEGSESAQKRQLSSLHTREREIELMKIRMICLGKCPSMLLGGTTKPKSPKTATFSQTQRNTEAQGEKAKDAKVATRLRKESMTSGETVQTMADHASRDAQTVGPEPACSLERTSATAEETFCSSAMRSKLSTDKAHSANLVPPLDESLSAIPSVENCVSLVPLNKVDLATNHRSDDAKTKATQDDKLSSNQACDKETNRSVNTAKVKMSKDPKTTAVTCNESSIAALKRRIAAIEKSRDTLKRQRQKRQKIDVSEQISGSDGMRPFPLHGYSERNKRVDVDLHPNLQLSSLGEHERTGAKRGTKERASTFNPRSHRYYVLESSNAVQALRSLEGKEKIGDSVETSDPSCDDRDTIATTNEKRAPGTAPQIPQDNVERRYIDDLKLELEQKRKELMNERDHAEQLKTAEVSIAEAQAKLNFTRSRVADLQDELRKAENDVLDAEKEYRRRARVAAQLRHANIGDVLELNMDQEIAVGTQYNLEDHGNGVLHVSRDLAFEVDSGDDKGPRREEDFVLRPSPYSPSTGDYFTSCLRAFRAYLLRIPHHSKAKDRVAGSILSPTWSLGLDPMKAVCPQELRGQCSNKDCDFQHLKVFRTPKDRALQVIKVIEKFFSTADRDKKEKTIINARIAIHEGKDAATTLSSLISSLCASLKTIPYSCAAE